ncbi:MAG TPA: N-acetylneuraminic acid synthase [Planctomycetes bacterium]|nr:N-acetylneuraminic acid synthase [Planctomycetota bacterium]
MSVQFVAEVSSNHGRDLDRALRFVDVAADIGCSAVKFQQFRVRELFAPEAIAANPDLLLREAWELPEEFHDDLAAQAHGRGIEYSCTPFHLSAVELLEPHVDFYKVASYQLLWHEFLREVAATAKPVVLATGMASLDEVREAVAVLKEAGAGKLTLLHCVSLYPTPRELANLRAIETLRSAFGVEVGWSDHSVSAPVVRRAVRRWAASMVEFHLDLDGMGEEYGGGHCWLPDEICRVIVELRTSADATEESGGSDPADGTGTMEPTREEAEERRWRTDPSDGLRPLLETRHELKEVAA